MSVYYARYFTVELYYSTYIHTYIRCKKNNLFTGNVALLHHVRPP